MEWSGRPGPGASGSTKAPVDLLGCSGDEPRRRVADARSKGVGDQLVNEVVRWAANQGAVAMALAVRMNNTFTIRLYERSGFVLIDGPANADEQVMSRSIR